jgi:capsular exopolysaccharide synthesis family protein
LDDSQIDLRAILGVLRRHLRLIFATFVIVVALAGVVVFALKPVYTASALVLVDTSRKNLLQPDDALTSASSDSARVDSEVELAKSETVLLQVVSDLKLYAEPTFAYKPGLIAQALSFLKIREPQAPTGDELLRDTLGKLRDAVAVQRRGLTYVISIQARSENREFAAKLANALAKTYISQQLQAKIDSTLAGRDTLQARVADSSTAVATSEDAVDNFISANIAAIQTETGRNDLEALNAQIAATEKQRSELATLVADATSSLQSHNYEALTASLQTAAVANLEAQRQKLQQSLNSAAQGSQTAIDIRAELDKVEANMTKEATAALDGLQGQISRQQTQTSDLRKQLRTDVLSSSLSSSTLTHIYELQQTAEIARSQYQTLLTRLKDLDQQAYVQVADSRVASEALPPDEPSFPNTRLLLALAGALGLGLGVGLAFLYENFVGGIVSEDQLRALIKARSVVTVPRQREIKGNTSLADNVLQAPLSLFSESIRKVRVSVDQSLVRSGLSTGQATGRGRVVLVTSAAPNEGKSTTSLALARAYALSGKTVLLIDCDLRKPSIHKHLGKDPETGLIDYLGETEATPPLRTIVSVDEKSGIGVLLGSRRSSKATDQLVAGQTFSRLIEAATQTFDIVILDTPPVGPVVDGVYLAQFADAVVFVVRWASTSQPEVRAAVRTISDGLRPDIEIVAVLAQSARPSSAYYGKYSSYYSEAPRAEA